MAELTAALQNGPGNKPFDAVAVGFPLQDVDQHLRLLEAAYAAGVKRYIPADWGSCDAADEHVKSKLNIYKNKNIVREKCEELAARAPSEGKPFTWTGIICGHFFDFGLTSGLLHFDVKKCTVTILDGGDIPASASTMGRIAEACAKVFENPDETKNKSIYVQSFNPTQNELLAALEKITGKKWTREDVSSKQYMEDIENKLDDPNKDPEAVENIVFVLGQIDADWTKRENFAMKTLGLEDENLEAVLERVIKGQ